jgi:lysophospholipase-2
MAEHTAAIVWLHGLGDCGASWTNLRAAAQAPHIKWVFPDAPNQPVSCNGGMKMPSWFDLEAIPVTADEPDDKVGLSNTVDQIVAMVRKLELEDGIPSERVMVGGFSQGGCASLLAALTCKHKLAGAVCFSGWLARCDEYPGLIAKANEQTPLFWGHGDSDDKVLYSLACKGRDKLLAIKKDLLTFKSYAGQGHCR